MVDSLETRFSEMYKAQDFSEFDVLGEPGGQYKNAGTFSYVRIYGAGHEVPAYEWMDVARGAVSDFSLATILRNLAIGTVLIGSSDCTGRIADF